MTRVTGCPSMNTLVIGRAIRFQRRHSGALCDTRRESLACETRASQPYTTPDLTRFLSPLFSSHFVLLLSSSLLPQPPCPLKARVRTVLEDTKKSIRDPLDHLAALVFLLGADHCPACRCAVLMPGDDRHARLWLEFQELEKLADPRLAVQIHRRVQSEAPKPLAEALEKLDRPVLDLDPLNEIPLKARQALSIEEAEDRLEACERPAKVLPAVAAAIVTEWQVPVLDQVFSICLTAGNLERIAHEVHQGHVGKKLRREVPVGLEEGMARFDVDSRRVPFDPPGLLVEKCLDRNLVAHRVVVDG